MLINPPDLLWNDPVLGPRIQSFWQRVIKLNALFPMFVPTSWYRSPEDNARLQGDLFSQHQIGLAVDEDAPGARELFPAFAAAARDLGLVAVEEGDHVHLQAFTMDANPLRVSPEVRRVAGLPTWVA